MKTQFSVPINSQFSYHIISQRTFDPNKKSNTKFPHDFINCHHKLSLLSYLLAVYTSHYKRNYFTCFFEIHLGTFLHGKPSAKNGLYLLRGYFFFIFTYIKQRRRKSKTNYLCNYKSNRWPPTSVLFIIYTRLGNITACSCYTIGTIQC